MFIPVLMLFILGLGVPMFSMLLGFMADSTPGWGWFAITLVSIASIAAAAIISIVARLQTKREE